MPPRIQTRRVSHSLLPYLAPSTTSAATSSPSCCSSTLPTPSITSSPCQRRTQQQQCRLFSSTPAPSTRLRQEMFLWLNGPGSALRFHTPGRTNYLTDLKRSNAASSEDSSSSSSNPAAPASGAAKPFPLNPQFVSESILSEELRNEIYERVVVKKKSVRAVSVELGVDMRRVAAVVRLVALERKWRDQGNPLALPYARSIHEMVPTTALATDGEPQRPHESINDLPVHRLTEPQIFYPVSESRQFTRIDAGRVFSAAPARLHTEAIATAANPSEAFRSIVQNPSQIERVGKDDSNSHKYDEETQILQPADVRIPHPQLIDLERARLAQPNEWRDRRQRYEERLREDEEAEAERKRLAMERAERKIVKIQPDSSRFEFRFKNVVVSKETTGSDGRGPLGTGRRYGVPNYDRKKGQVKIPTKVVV